MPVLVSRADVLLPRTASRRNGSLLTTLVWSMVLPFSVYLFAQPLPYLGASPPLGRPFFWGLYTLLFGVALYNAQQFLPKKKKKQPRQRIEPAV